MPDFLVVRPEPGNARTAARLRDGGGDVACLPLFAAVAVDWAVPDLARFDALLVTSANAVRHAGPGLAELARLPVIAVGAETAAVARAAGLHIAVTGPGGVTAALAAARAQGLARPLHLAGRDHVDSGHPIAIVYASVALPVDEAALAALARDRIVLLHSERAARRLAGLIADRCRTGIAALSPAVCAAAGDGWRTAQATPTPTDAALCALALDMAGERAIDPARHDGDKRP